MKEDNTKANLFDLMVNGVKDVAIFTLDAHGKIATWNPGGKNLFGYTKKEIIGKPLSTIFPNLRQKNQLHYDLQQAIDSGQYTHETEVFTKNKKKIYVKCIVTALWGKDSKLQGFSKIVEDITQQKKKEDRREEIISLAGHELKNPLTSIKSYVQLAQMKLAKRKEDTELSPIINKTAAQIEKLGALLNDILDTSKISIGTFPFHDKDAIEIDSFVEEIVDTLLPTFPNHRLIIKGKTNTKLLLDKNRFEQVISNLLLNAAKYSPKGKKIIVHLSKTKEDVVIAVQDFGIGIPKKEIPHLFDRFYRGNTAKKLGQGLGLGLYLAREILRHYKGNIWIESKPQKGTTFFISLPLKEL